MEQGSQYNEEQFQVPTGGTQQQRPRTLRPQTPVEMANEPEPTDEEEYYPDDYDNSDKMKKILIIVGIVVAALIMVVLIVLGVSSTKSKDGDEPETEASDSVDDPNMDYEALLQQAQMEQELNNPEPVEEVEKFSYSKKERSILASWGLNADEIDECEAEETPYKEAVEERRNMYLDNMADIYRALLRNADDSPDEAYHYVLGNSIFGLPPMVIDSWSTDEQYFTKTDNVDYRKLPLQGFQPMIRCTIPNTDKVLYVNISYLQYQKLEHDTGNCRITYDCAVKDGVTTYSNVRLVND